MSAVSNNISRKSNGIENSMLSILFVAGILGVFYFLKNPDLTQADLGYVGELEHHQIPHTGSGTQDGNTAYLSIEGAMEQDIPIYFTINSFNDQVSYVLDFGNGTRRSAIEPVTRYTYRESGDFRVKLIAIYQGTEKVLHSEVLIIDRNSEVAVGF